MKLRKFLALSMALALAVCPMQVAAAGGTVTSDPTTVSGNTIAGDVNYVNTTIYKVTLPTTTGLSFALDPQGLSTLDNSGTYDEGEAGKIVGTGTMEAKNESSVSVNLIAEFYLTDSAASAVNLLSLEDMASIDNSAKEMCLTIQQSDQQTSPTYTDYAAITSKSSSAPTSVSIPMEAADYKFAVEDGEYVYKIDSAGTTFTKEVFQFAGVVAKDYDWSAYTGEGAETLTLNAIFKFSDPNASTSGSTDTYVMTKGADGCATYTFVNAPTGALTNVTVNGAAKTAMLANGYFTYTNGVFKVDATRTTNLLASSATVVVTIGGANYTLTYTA